MNRIRNKLKSLTFIDCLQWFFLFLFFVLTITFLHKNMVYMLDSDMSSELVLAKLLNMERHIFSPNWYYSTELRVFNTQLIFAPLFSITNNWHTVRIIGTTILLLILLFSFYYLHKQLGLKNYPIYGLVLLCPLSVDYFVYVLKGVYYIPHITITFLSLGLVIRIIQSPLNKTVAAHIIILNLLALFSGMGGLRQLLILYVPLWLTSLYFFIIEQKQRLVDLKFDKINYSFRLFCHSTLTMLFSALGFLINSVVFSSQYTFYQYDKLRFQSFVSSRFDQILNAWINLLGYWPNMEIFSKKYLFLNLIFLMLFLILVVAVVKGLKDKNKWHRFIVVFFCVSVGVLTGLYLFSDMFFRDRYLLPVTICFVPVIAIYIQTLEQKRLRYLIFCGCILGVVLVGFSFYLARDDFDQMNAFYDTKTNEELMQIAGVLEEKQYYNGYATFWDANVLTEMSNGRIEVWTLKDNFIDSSGKVQLNEIYKWLQVKSHENTKPVGKVFVILNYKQYNNAEQTKIFDSSRILYQSDQYSVYGFTNYQELENEVGGNP